MARVYIRGTVEERFAFHLDKNGPIPLHRPELGPCHVWRGGTSSGYGAIRAFDKNMRAHVVAFFLKHGRWGYPVRFTQVRQPPMCSLGPSL